MSEETKTAPSAQKSPPLSRVPIDFCLVLPYDDNKKTNTDDILERIEKQTTLKIEKTFTKEKLFCQIGAPMTLLKHWADILNKEMLLNDMILSDCFEFGDEELGLEPFQDKREMEKSIKIMSKDFAVPSSFKPYGFVYTRYDTHERYQRLYEKAEGLDHPFSSKIRIQLIEAILTSREEIGGAELGLRTMLDEKDLLAAYPMHDEDKLEELADEWFLWLKMPQNQPVTSIRNYFGEKVAFYYSFLGHYTCWALYPAILGIIVQTIMWKVGNPEHLSAAFFALFIVLWGIFMVEAWKRQEARLSMQWGTAGREATLPPRPEYFGEPMLCPITGEEIVHFPQHKKLHRQLRSLVILACCFLILFISLSAIFSFRYFLVYVKGIPAGATIAAFVNACQILMMNAVYSRVAVYMTNLENHKTDALYEDTLIVKVFSFQFCNTFASFFYIGFGSLLQGTDCEGGCMFALAQNIVIIFLTSLVFQNLSETLVPLMTFKCGMNRPKNTARQCEKEYSLARYHELLNLVNDYCELAIQFGFLTMFVSAYPLLPLLAVINNWVEIRTDAYKIMYLHQRPMPRFAQDIGSWKAVFQFIAVISVVTNSAIVTFVMQSTFMGFSLQVKVWAFAIIQYLVFGIQWAIELIVPDVPTEVNLQLKRSEFLSEKVMHAILEEEEHRTNLLKENQKVLQWDDKEMIKSRPSSIIYA